MFLSSVKEIEGTWFIKISNFPMWNTNKKTKPTFNYTVLDPDSEKPYLLDEVVYFANGKKETITGYDYVQNKENTSFQWKGKGILFFFVSNWTIEWINETKDVAIVRFGSTLFTPSGFDIISRKEDISSEELKDALSQLKEEEKKTLFYIDEVNQK
jgi:hypothetical protein